MSDQQPRTLSHMGTRDPPSHSAVKFLTASTVAGTSLVLSGLTLTGTVIALILATPLLVLFSPVLVPASVVIFLVTSGFLFSGGCGLAAIMALIWMYKYVTGKYPPGAAKLDYARGQIARKANDMKEYGQSVQQKTQEATQTRAS